MIIRGERAGEKETKDEDFYRSERWTDRFNRTIPLRSSVATEKADASFKNGVLEVNIPKTDEKRGHHITVK